MILRLCPPLQHPQRFARIQRSFRHDFEQHGLAHMVRAGAGDQNSRLAEQPQRAKIDVLIAARAPSSCLRDFAKAGGSSTTISKSAARGSVARQQIEGIGFAEIDIGNPIRLGVARWLLRGRGRWNRWLPRVRRRERDAGQSRRWR